MSSGSSDSGGKGAVVITGGSGFIGSNLADSFLADGEDVLIVDNLSRRGVEQNLDWLRRRHGGRVQALIADVRDAAAIAPAFARAKAVYHFAAQTAVTTSLDDPGGDFEINARGTLNVLQAVLATGRRIPVVYSSTNKVYGNLGDIEMREQGDRYVPADDSVAANGLGEARPLDFCTPYGCSKGVADQYVLDFASSYGLPTAVLRMSCIYGPRQFGTEDQGWVAHFLIRALAGEPISIYGDGRQVRDVLHVSDAVAAYRAVLARIDDVRGEAFNLGGGPANAVSLRELLDEIGVLTNGRVQLSHGDWRRGDQLYYVADTRKLQKAVGWRAGMSWRDGVRDLARWLRESRAADPLLPVRGRVVA